LEFLDERLLEAEEYFSEKVLKRIFPHIDKSRMGAVERSAHRQMITEYQEKSFEEARL
jgi:hypothetical protein